jgi:hypothetical protein
MSPTRRLAPSATGPPLEQGDWPRSSCRCVGLNDARTVTRSTTICSTTNPPPLPRLTETRPAARAAMPAAKAVSPPASRDVHGGNRPSKHGAQSRRLLNRTRSKRGNESFPSAKQTRSKRPTMALRLCFKQTKPHPIRVLAQDHEQRRQSAAPSSSPIEHRTLRRPDKLAPAR